MAEKWDVFYKAAIDDDGKLFFPERLTHEFLNEARTHMGTQFFTNQYLNKVIDEESKPFKKSWIKYYDTMPSNVYKYTFIDPAISQKDSADFTAVINLAVDENQNWYVVEANRYKITPTELINLMFQICMTHDPIVMGVESVAFQKVLIYMVHEEMKRRNIVIPVQGIQPATTKTKQMKILGLVPRFEWGSIFINRGLTDFEQEYYEYAGERSKHDDLLDALASIDAVITYPSPLKQELKDVPSNHPDYERIYRQKLAQGQRGGNF